MKRTITSMAGISNFKRGGFTENTYFKRSAILFEEIIFNPQGTGAWEGGFYNFHEFIGLLCSHDKQKSKILANNDKFRKLIVNCWEYVESAADFESSVMKTLPLEVQKKIWSYAYPLTMKENEFLHNDEFKHLVGDLTYDLSLFTRFKQEFPDTSGNISSIYSDIFDPNLGISQSAPIELIAESTYIPDFSTLSWDLIFELREESLVKDFREKFHSFNKASSKTCFDLNECIIDSLWSLARQVQPNVGATTLSAIVTNIPTGPIPNPLAVANSLKDVYNSKKLKDQYGWVFFIQHLREKTRLLKD
jgi:hypothetical protein